LRLTAIKDREKKIPIQIPTGYPGKGHQQLQPNSRQGYKNIFQQGFRIKSLNIIRYLRQGLMKISVIKNKKVIQYG
jgi:hypothetical protein